MPVPADPPPRTCRVDGEYVESLYAILLPSPNGPSHLIGPDGTHEITRVYFDEGHFSFGHGNDKLGACSIMRAQFDESGCQLFAHDGRVIDIPRVRFGGITYKLAA